MLMMPSIFGENLFNDDWMDFSFPMLTRCFMVNTQRT